MHGNAATSNTIVGRTVLVYDPSKDEAEHENGCEANKYALDVVARQHRDRFHARLDIVGTILATVFGIIHDRPAISNLFSVHLDGKN